MNLIRCMSVLLFFGFLCTQCFAQTEITIAEINAVDSDGNPTFAGLQTLDKYTIEGIALNQPGVFNNYLDDGTLDQTFNLFVQDDTGGIQVYSGYWYGGGLSKYPDVQEGDLVQVTGLTGHYGGKTNINERHNPDQMFEVTILGQGTTPEPFPITNLAEVTAFDSTRQTGGEYYQGRLVQFIDVTIVEGTWAAGEFITVADSQGNTCPILLNTATEICDSPQPQGTLNITGIFDQEDTEAPYTEGYQLWPRSIDDFRSATTSSFEGWDVYK
jgi:predicted extracellular nuclease